MVTVTKKMVTAATKAHHEFWCGKDPDHKQTECEAEAHPGLIEAILEAGIAADGRRASRG